VRRLYDEWLDDGKDELSPSSSLLSPHSDPSRIDDA
jgi:hypothetical protein